MMSIFQTGPGKTKGDILLHGVLAIEEVDYQSLGKQNVFQVGTRSSFEFKHALQAANISEKN